MKLVNMTKDELDCVYSELIDNPELAIGFVTFLVKAHQTQCKKIDDLTKKLNDVVVSA